MRRGRILLVEDDDTLRHITQLHLRKQGYATSSAPDAAQALDILEREPQDLVITDIYLPGMSGLELLKIVRAKFPESQVIMITAFATVVSAVEALKSGATDYVTKPIHMHELNAIVERLMERVRLVDEVNHISERFLFPNIVGRSQAFLFVLDQAVRVASTDATVLIQGETGTGKEVVARAIHLNSPRRDRPFVTINCATIPKDLLESELFGHLRGAFTGAHAHKKGRVETAEGGTLFLDELGELPLELQTRLLRMIQQREIEKIGATHATKVDVRIIAATNRDLKALVASGGFREDLYYRLAVIPIELPPLRNRADDIPDFVQYFFKASKHRHRKPQLVLPANLVPYFTAYSWPGNMRQLENVIERIVVLSDNKEVSLSDLPEFLLPPRLQSEHPQSVTEGMSLHAVERDLIVQALCKSKWNQTRAARYLGITRKTLMYRMAKYKITREARRHDLSKKDVSSQPGASEAVENSYSK